ncbi:MAG: TonB-dependent receptor [Kaiparowitsia implicata GSE-PSE-MK54-09C]|nr:TonB-dependent receptor [Kaiparowitsia implicata GSE-PSE-MK54-09C]
MIRTSQRALLSRAQQSSATAATSMMNSSIRSARLWLQVWLIVGLAGALVLEQGQRAIAQTHPDSASTDLENADLGAAAASQTLGQDLIEQASLAPATAPAAGMPAVIEAGDAESVASPALDSLGLESLTPVGRDRQWDDWMPADPESPDPAAQVSPDPLSPASSTGGQEDASSESHTGSSDAPSADRLTAPPASPALSQTPVIVEPIPATEWDSGADEVADFSLELFPSESGSTPADNRSTIALTGRITDDSGAAVTEPVIVTLTATAGQFLGADYDRDRPGFQVRALNGEFTVQLQSTLEAQRVRVRAAVERRQLAEMRRSRLSTPLPRDSRSERNTETPLPLPGDEIEAYTEVSFTTELRPSLVTGGLNLRIGRAGTNYFGSFRDFLAPESLDPNADVVQGTEVDFGATLFGIGTVGEWSFLGAYNSSRPLNETCDGSTRLFREDQSCEQVYPTYGDSSTVDFLTPSSDSLFLRFQRDARIPGAEPDFAMWGDYNTPEFSRSSQLFGATNRQLHGFRGNYNLGNFQVTGLFATDIEGFQRDTIAPDGTSGFYFLSRRLVIGGSETVFLELEELGRPGVVVERQALNRGADYEIDYDRGTLLFRRPIQRTVFDPFGRTLVRRIVASYQFEGGDDTNLYAGRLQYNFSHGLTQGSWAAVSYLNEDQGDRTYELYGADFQIPLGSDGRIVGEIARSAHELPLLGNVSGTAYRLEANAPLGDSLRAQLLYRSVDDTFINNATTSFRPGQTRLGAALAATLSPSTQLQVRYDFEENFGTSPLILTDLAALLSPGLVAQPGAAVNNTLTTVSVGALQQVGTATLGLEFVNRNRNDRTGDTALNVDSSQLVTRVDWPVSDRLTVRAQNDLTLSGDEDPIYPGRTALGLSWQMDQFTTLDVSQQFFYGGVFGTNSITSLGTNFSRQLTEDTTLSRRYSIVGGINGMMGQQSVGIQHGVTVAPGLRLSLNYERIAEDILLETGAGQQFEQPFAVGQSASALGLSSGESYSVGLEYTDNPNFQASARLERRVSTTGNNTVWTAGAAGRLTPELTALLRYRQANYGNSLLTGQLGDTSEARLGLAYRNPRSDRFNALLSYRYRTNPALTPSNILVNTGTGSEDHTLSAEALFAPDWRWEFYGKFALRHSNSFLANDLTVNNTITLAQARAAYRLGYRWDLAGEARWIHQTTNNFDEVGLSAEVGYYATPDLRIGVGYSFGEANDSDLGSDRSAGGVFLNISLKVNELFGGFGRQRIAPPQQQESEIIQATTPDAPQGGE